MDKFTVHQGTAVPLRRSNVDTDQIIPAVYLKRVTRTGFEDGLFHAWRTNEPDFVLNQSRFDGASILVAGPDFGTGSSREHAVWALVDYGFKVVTGDRLERQGRWSGEVHDFELDDYSRWRLLEGLDDIGLTLAHTDEIAQYETARKPWLPTATV